MRHHPAAAAAFRRAGIRTRFGLEVSMLLGGLAGHRTVPVPSTFVSYHLGLGHAMCANRDHGACVGVGFFCGIRAACLGFLGLGLGAGGL